MNESWVLLLIDCQMGFNDSSWGQRNNPHFEVNAKAVLAQWRALGGHVIHVRHASLESESPLRAEVPGFAFFDWAQPMGNELEIVKNVNSCFIGTALEQVLRSKGHQNIVVFGLTTNHCVSTTVRMAGNLGFEVCLVGDACATFSRTASDGEVFDADLLHRTALASLHGEFCNVISTEHLLADSAFIFTASRDS
jgi:nicotinamidase-related amidase